MPTNVAEFSGHACHVNDSFTRFVKSEHVEGDCVYAKALTGGPRSPASPIWRCENTGSIEIRFIVDSQQHKGLARTTHSLLTTVSVACRVVFEQVSDSVSAALAAVGAFTEVTRLNMGRIGDDKTCAFC